MRILNGTQKNYLKGASGAIIICDLTRKKKLKKYNKHVLFDSGRVLVTRGILQMSDDERSSTLGFLARHLTGDWGDLCKEDRQENELSLRERFRILSSYKTAKGDRLWIITEWDRSYTTLLLPEEY